MENESMDAHRFDTVAKRLAQSHVSRRMTIKTSGLGLLVLAAGTLGRRGGASAEVLPGVLAAQSTSAATPAAGTSDAPKQALPSIPTSPP
jgi:hypothetical protein